ncbi:MAG: acyltransferase family protein [Polyangiaceae bacterium]|nr:acyltransferase family protein [Polyangiaceae bacterium]
MSERPASDVAGRIRALEARLDSMLDRTDRSVRRAEARAPVATPNAIATADPYGSNPEGPFTAPSRPVNEGLDGALPEPLADEADDVEDPDEADDVEDVEDVEDADEAAPSTEASPRPALDPRDPARRSRFFRQKWGRKANRRRAAEVDEFGLDPEFERRFAQPVLDFLFRRYFRTKVIGIDHVPGSGRCLIVANHSGTVPLDGPMLRTAVRLAHPTGRDVRWLSEGFLYYLPFAGTFITRTGAVRACAENTARLLETDRCVVAFPEGVAGIRKLYRDRYRLQRFGRGGFIRLALRAGAPIVPCAIVGAEETGPMLLRDELVARWIGLPYLPITPTFPWLGPLGLAPAPTRWTIRFGEPLALDEYGPSAIDDDLLVARLGEHVRTTIQQLLDDGVRTRRSVWFG